MSTWPRRVLLACYEFPPSSGIGGRRWAKLAKGLAAGGTEVHVLAAEPAPGHSTSQWTGDVTHPRIHVERLPRAYPEAVARPRRTLGGRVAYRWALRRLRRITKGTVFDTALGWDEHFIPAARRLLGGGDFDAIIATGAPFHLLYLAALVKREHAKTRLLVDYRDPWIGAVNYGMSDLDASQLQAELEKQRVVIQEADVVTAPNQVMVEGIRSSDPALDTLNTRFAVLSHFFDPEDQGPSPQAHAPSEGELRLVYGGDLYMGLRSLWSAVDQALDTLRREDSALYARTRIEIYSNAVGRFPEPGRHAGVLSFKPSIGGKILDRIRTSSAALILLEDHNKDFLTTKFFEYLPCRRPYVVIGPRGDVARFVEDNRLGVAVDAPAEALPDVLRALAQGDVEFDPDYDVSHHTLADAARRLAALLAAD